MVIDLDAFLQTIVEFDTFHKQEFSNLPEKVRLFSLNFFHELTIRM
jgi:hypothetical protein